jgi:Tfp pilus assembly protein PilX
MVLRPFNDANSMLRAAELQLLQGSIATGSGNIFYKGVLDFDNNYKMMSEID